MRALPIRNTSWVSVPKCFFNSTCTPLGPHFLPKLVPSWRQVGAKLAPSWTQDPLENNHKTMLEKTRPKRVVEIHLGTSINSGLGSWGPLRKLNPTAQQHMWGIRNIPLRARGPGADIYIYIYIYIEISAYDFSRLGEKLGKLFC